MFTSIADVRARLEAQRYVASDEIATVVFLAERLGKPVLAEGPAGVGKTELAKVWAAASGRELVRLQCYEGLDETKALYEWEYAKQLLYTQLLRDALGDVLAGATNLAEAADRLAAEENVFFSERFLLPRPLLRALTSEHPVVLLIDEIDRADAEFEAFLLEVLSDFQITIPELGTIKAAEPPIVVITTNRTREIHDALKRRCLYHWVDYPDAPRELAILAAKAPGAGADLSREIVLYVQRLRQIDLFKAPGVAETLDWATALIELDKLALDPQTVNDTIGVLLKYQDDIARIQGSEGKKLLDEVKSQARAAANA